MSVATQPVQLDDGWVFEQELEQPMNEQAGGTSWRACVFS